MERPHPDRYIALVGRGARPKPAPRSSEGAARDDEAAMLCLRTRVGVAGRLAGAASLLADGLAERDGDRIVLTPAGRLLANEATARLLLAGTSR